MTSTENTACSPTSVASSRVFRSEDFERESMSFGHGGCGALYKGTHRTTKEVFALKKIMAAPSDKWEREVSSLQRLTHDNIVKCFGSFRMDGFFTVVMELIDGVTLDKFVASNPPAEGLCDRWYRQLVSALACIHRKGLIHRDVKPSNLVVRRGGHDIVLIDFGLARDIAADMSVVGTRSYFSYEKFFDKPYDGRDDVWALGMTFAFVLTEEKPWLLSMDPSVNREVHANIRSSNRASPFLASQIISILEGVEQENRPTSEALLATIVAHDGVVAPVPALATTGTIGEPEDGDAGQTATNADSIGTLAQPVPLATGPAMEASGETWLDRTLPAAADTAILSMPPQSPPPGSDERTTVMPSLETQMGSLAVTQPSQAIFVLGPVAGIPLRDLDDRSAVALLALIGCSLPANLRQLDPRLPEPGGGAYLATIDRLEALAVLEGVSSDDWERRSVLETAVFPALQKLQREWVPIELLGDIKRFVSKPAAVPPPEIDDDATNVASAEEAAEEGEGDAAENDSDAPTSQSPQRRKRQASAAVKFFRPLVRAAKSAEKVVVKEVRKIERQLSKKK